MSSAAPTLRSIKDAAARIAPHVHRTPLHRSSALDEQAGLNLFFKCESFQRTGSFKIRGATNAIFSLSADVAARGVVTQSSGNHGMAVALAARLRGIDAHVVVPENTPLVKQEAIKGYGANLVHSGNTMAEREAKAEEVLTTTGGTLVHPYNDVDVMSGQGTMALELLEQFSELVSESEPGGGEPELDAIVVPVSGCGMISGIAIAAKTQYPDVKIIAAEPSGANNCPDVVMSLEAGALIGPASCGTALPPIACAFAKPHIPARILPLSVTNRLDGVRRGPATICDGLRGHMKDLTWAVVSERVDSAIAVDDSEVIAAMALVYERMKLVIEPSAGAGLAAVLAPGFREAVGPDCKNVGVILCGGNIDLGRFMDLMHKDAAKHSQ